MSSSDSSQPLFRHGGPTYTHDCINCKWLGTVERLISSQVPGDVTEVDLYAHYEYRAGTATDVVARYGNEPNQVVSGAQQSPFAAVNDPEPHLAAAATRAIQLGFLRVSA
jgi:hypothetical protein